MDKFTEAVKAIKEIKTFCDNTNKGFNLEEIENAVIKKCGELDFDFRLALKEGWK